MTTNTIIMDQLGSPTGKGIIITVISVAIAFIILGLLIKKYSQQPEDLSAREEAKIDSGTQTTISTSSADTIQNGKQ